MKLDKTIVNRPGIYIIKNTVTGKVYVGSSKVCRKRLWEHNNHLLKNKHVSTNLQNSFNRYGPDAFICYVLEYTELSSIRAKEKEYMIKFKSTDKRFGYNLVQVTDTGGYIYTDERRALVSKNTKKYYSQMSTEEKMRLSKIKQNNTNRYISELSSEEKRKRTEKAVLTTSKQVQSSIGEVFSSIAHAARHYNVSTWTVAHSCSGGKSRKLPVTFKYVKECVNETSF